MSIETRSSHGSPARPRACVVGLTLAFALLAPDLGAQPVVSGGGTDRALAWRLERRWSVGGSEDEEVMLESLGADDIATDRNGRLLLIELGRARVLEYDSTGRLRRTLGRKGKGPGELSAPFAIDVAADGTIHVYDIEKGAFVVFGPDGTVLSERRQGSRVRSPKVMMGGDLVFHTRRSDTLNLLVETGGRRDTLMRWPEAPTRSTPPVCRLTEWPAPPVFGANLLWDASGDRVVAATDGFAITVFERAKALRVLTRSTQRRRSTSALARQQVGEGEWMQLLGERPCRIPAEMILSVAEVARELPAYAELAVAPDGRIWAQRYVVKGEPGVADVFDPVRGYEGSVALGGARPVGFLSNGDMVSIERDADEVPIIVVYAVRR